MYADFHLVFPSVSFQNKNIWSLSSRTCSRLHTFRLPTRKLLAFSSRVVVGGCQGQSSWGLVLFLLSLLIRHLYFVASLQFRHGWKSAGNNVRLVVLLLRTLILETSNSVPTLLLWVACFSRACSTSPAAITPSVLIPPRSVLRSRASSLWLLA